MKNLFIIGIFACLALRSVSAQEVAGINFGTAGPNSWGILALGGTGGTQCGGASCFGNSGTTLGLNNGGVFGSSTNANVGVDGGKSSVSGPGYTINGTEFLSTSTINNNSSFTGVVVQNTTSNTLLSGAASDAAHGVSIALSLACNMGALCNNAIATGETINPSGTGTCVVGGTCVLYVSSIGLNHQTLTLGGGASTNWVIIDSGNMNVQSGGILEGGGGASHPQNALIVVTGSMSVLQTSGGPNPDIDAVVIVPKGSVSMSSGTINGEIIVGGSSAQIVSASQVNVPVPVPDDGRLTLLVAGFVCCGGLFMRYRSEGSH